MNWPCTGIERLCFIVIKNGLISPTHTDGLLRHFFSMQRGHLLFIPYLGVVKQRNTQARAKTLTRSVVIIDRSLAADPEANGQAPLIKQGIEK